MSVPVMNSKFPERWEQDRAIAKTQIIQWLAAADDSSELRATIESNTYAALRLLVGTENLAAVIFKRPQTLEVLRFLTRRQIGTSQMATFLGITTNKLESFEAGRNTSLEIAKDAAAILATELDTSVAGWILDSREPSSEELSRSTWIASDRMLLRKTSTELRYKHEPRQLGKLEHYLKSQGYTEVPGSSIGDPRKGMHKGNYAFRVNVEGTTSDGLSLKQTVDALIKPFSKSDNLLPIFLEAKSMTDEVNPNKRQKEEAQKVESARRRWQTNGEKLNFILLLGGTVPRRYLEVEAGSDLDWIWEHRVEDLEKLLEWYVTQ